MKKIIAYSSKIIFLIFMTCTILLTLFTNVVLLVDDSSYFWILMLALFFSFEWFDAFKYKKSKLLLITNTVILLEILIYFILK